MYDEHCLLVDLTCMILDLVGRLLMYNEHCLLVGLI